MVGRAMAWLDARKFMLWTITLWLLIVVALHLGPARG
jgi:hypothetical protein